MVTADWRFAALLIRVASTCGQMSGEQREKLGVLLKDCFDLDGAATNDPPCSVTSVLERRFPRRRGQIEFGAVEEPVS
jgi:hypothetical protein